MAQQSITDLINGSHLQIEKTFIKDSKLHQYLSIKQTRTSLPYIRITNLKYSLSDIYKAIEIIITKEGLFDKNNPFIIIGDDSFEYAFGIRAFQTFDLQKLVEQHLLPSLHIRIKNLPITGISPPNRLEVLTSKISLTPPSWAETKNIEIPLDYISKAFKDNDLFWVDPKLLLILRKVKNADQIKLVFTYLEIVNLFKTYVDERKTKFISYNRFPFIIICFGDPLCTVLKMQSFHANQVPRIMQTFLRKYDIISGVSLPNELDPGINPFTEPESADDLSDEGENSYQTMFEDENGFPSELDIPHVDSSAEDSTFSETIIKKVEYIPVDLGDEAEIDSNTDVDKKTKTKFTDVKECHKCGKLRCRQLSYCIPCWKELKSLIPGRDKVRKRKRNKIVSSVLKMQAPLKMGIIKSNLCRFCYTRDKNACFVHGNLSHQISCYVCAKVWFKQKGTCPICRRKVDKLIKNIII